MSRNELTKTMEAIVNVGLSQSCIVKIILRHFEL